MIVFYLPSGQVREERRVCRHRCCLTSGTIRLVYGRCCQGSFRVQPQGGEGLMPKEWVPGTLGTLLRSKMLQPRLQRLAPCRQLTDTVFPNPHQPPQPWSPIAANYSFRRQLNPWSSQVSWISLMQLPAYEPQWLAGLSRSQHLSDPSSASARPKSARCQGTPPPCSLRGVFLCLYVPQFQVGQKRTSYARCCCLKQVRHRPR